jgi:hypothetical protein
VTKNEILYSLNKLEDYILAIVEFEGERATPYYIRQPFWREPDFVVTSVNYDFAELVARVGAPPARDRTTSTARRLARPTPHWWHWVDCHEYMVDHRRLI